MNNNKQQTKGNKMKKIAMVIGVLTVMATSANAGYWTHTPTFGGGYKSTYTPTYNYLLGGWN
tara:strand:- start:404 stop:589 length:186 start_codon:yes stop_codon:yes gene_type:complete